MLDAKGAKLIIYCDAAGNPAGYGLPFNVIDECSGTVTSTIRYINTLGVSQGTSKPAAWEPCTTCCPTRFTDVLCYDDGVNAVRAVQVVTTIDEASTVTVLVYELDGTPILPTPAAATLAVCTDGGVADTSWNISDGTTTNRVDPGDTVLIESDNPNLTVVVTGDTVTLDYDLCADAADSFVDGGLTPVATDRLLGIDASGACVQLTPASGADYVATGAGAPTVALDGVDTYIDTTTGDRYEWQDTDGDGVGDTWTLIVSPNADYVATGTVDPTVAIDGVDTYLNTTDGTRWEWRDTDGDGVGDTWVAVSTAVTIAPDDGAGCTTNGLESLGTGLWVDPNPVHVFETGTLPMSLVSDRGASFWFGPATNPMPLPGAYANVFRSHIGSLNLGNPDPGSFLSTTDASRLGSVTLPVTTDSSYIFVAVITSGGGNGPGAVALNTTSGNTETWKVLGSIQHPDYGMRHTVMWTAPTEFGAANYTVEAALAVWAYAATIEFGFISGVWDDDPFQGWDAGYSQNAFAPMSAAATAFGDNLGPIVTFASGHDYDEADINNFGPFIRETGGTFNQFGADGYSVTQSSPGNFASLFAVDDLGVGAAGDSGQFTYKTEQNSAHAILSVARLRRRAVSNETLLQTLNLPGVVNPTCNPTMQEVLTITTAESTVANLDMLLHNGDWYYAYVEVDGTYYENLGQLDLSRSTAEAMQIAFPTMTAVIQGPTVAPGATGPAHTVRIWIGSQGRGGAGLDSYMLVPGVRVTSELVHI